MTKKIKGFEDTIEWYNSNAQKYAKNIEKYPNVELIDKFIKVVGKGGKILDAGCAAGRDSRIFKDKGMEPVGIDLSKSLLKIAKEKNPNIEFVQGNFLNLPFKDEVFDGVWSHASLLHFETTEEVQKALKEFHRVLKKGRLVHVFVKKQMGEEKTSVVSDKLSGHDRFFQWFTGREIEELLKEAHFKIIELQDGYDDPAGRKEVKWIVAIARKSK